MIKTFMRIIAASLLLFGMPLPFFALAGSKPEKKNANVLVFVGAARRHLRLEDSINAALRDAARKVAFFHSVSGEIVTHESNGALVGSTFVTVAEIKDPDDYERYLDKLEYNVTTDVYESENAVFVQTRYRSSAIIGINCMPIRNNEKPQWVDNPPAQIGHCFAAVGFSPPKLYHSDTIIASYENAIINLIESSGAEMRVIESQSKTSNNAVSLSIASGTLTGFYVVDTWTDPITKAVWTLTVASSDR